MAMPNSFLEMFLAPVSAESPCGPDLDEADDAEFNTTVARTELILPGTFFAVSPQDGNAKPFDRTSVKFPAEIAAVTKILQRSRDLRLAVILAKFAILDRDLSTYVDIVEAIAKALDALWTDVHPNDGDEDYELRSASLAALDDWDHAVYPLQFVPLIRHPRHGNFSFRTKVLLDGTQPRNGEAPPNAAEMDRAFGAIEVADLVAQRDLFARLLDAIRSIKEITADRLGPTRAIDIGLVRGLCEQIHGFLNGWIDRRDPYAAIKAAAADGDAMDATASLAGPRHLGPIASFADVEATLKAVASFLRVSEPSSPALPLVSQAQQLVGKSFADVIGILLPDHIEAAAVSIGRSETFRVPISRLPAGEEAIDWTQRETFAPLPEVQSRNAALSALQQIEAFYAQNEPTSPVPFFCERARTFATRDFMAILKDIMPDDALRTIDRN